MIYVDSNVPMYLVGAEHPHKQRVVALTPQLLAGREELVTTETFQGSFIATAHCATANT
jgi:predicted nucleic acid-binding protein